MISASEARWFTDMWKAAGEPPLSERRDTERRAAWRFTTLPTWGPPVIVRIEENRGGAYTMVAKRLSGQGGYEPGRVAAQVRRQLRSDEVRTFREQLAAFSPMWAAPRDCRWGTDGTIMIFETAGVSGYQVAQRWSPEGGPMRSLAEIVVSFTGWGSAAAG